METSPLFMVVSREETTLWWAVSGPYQGDPMSVFALAISLVRSLTKTMRFSQCVASKVLGERTMFGPFHKESF